MSRKIKTASFLKNIYLLSKIWTHASVSITSYISLYTSLTAYYWPLTVYNTDCDMYSVC